MCQNQIFITLFLQIESFHQVRAKLHMARWHLQKQSLYAAILQI